MAIPLRTVTQDMIGYIFYESLMCFCWHVSVEYLRLKDESLLLRYCCCNALVKMTKILLYFQPSVTFLLLSSYEIDKLNNQCGTTMANYSTTKGGRGWLYNTQR